MRHFCGYRRLFVKINVTYLSDTLLKEGLSDEGDVGKVRRQI